MVSLRRQLASTVVWQGSGAAATVLATLWLGAALGPQQQGQFNALKSLIELGAALAMLGMPQALYVFVQRGELALRTASVLARRVAWVGLPVGAVLLTLHDVPTVVDAPRVPALPTIALAGALAVAAATLQGQWRALLLLAPQTRAFNVSTALPQWGLLLLAAMVVVSGGLSLTSVAWGLVTVWVLAAVATWPALGRLPQDLCPPSRPDGAAPLGALARHGAATWIATSLAAASIVWLQQAAASRGGSLDLGRISMALILAQVPLVPLNYALPMLLRHGLQRDGAQALWRHVHWAALPMLALAALVLTIGGWRSDLGLGEDYTGLHRLLGWILLAGVGESVLRLVSVDAHAAGRPWRNSASEALRFTIMVGGTLSGASLGAPDAPEALVRWWALAAIAAAGFQWVRSQRP